MLNAVVRVNFRKVIESPHYQRQDQQRKTEDDKSGKPSGKPFYTSRAIITDMAGKVPLLVEKIAGLMGKSCMWRCLILFPFILIVGLRLRLSFIPSP